MSVLEEVLFDHANFDVKFDEKDFHSYLETIVMDIQKYFQHVSCYTMSKILEKRLYSVIATNVEGKTYRDVLSFPVRKSYLITKAVLNWIQKEAEKPEIAMVPQEFLYIVESDISECTLWELRTLMINFRMNMNFFKFSSSITSLMETLQRKLLWFVCNRGDPEKELIYYDIALLVQIFDKGTGSEVEKNGKEWRRHVSKTDHFLSVSDEFIEMAERFIYWMERRKYFIDDELYIVVPFKVMNELILNCLSIMRGYLDKPSNIKNFDKQVSKRIADWLVLESEIETFTKYAGKHITVTSIDVLKRFRTPVISQYWIFIRDETGVSEWLVKKLSDEEYFRYFQSERSDPVIERSIFSMFQNLILYATKFKLVDYTILEKEIQIPVQSNKFFNSHIPFIVQTWKGWCVWIPDEKKLAAFCSFVEALVVFLLIVKFVSGVRTDQCCSEVLHKNFFTNSKNLIESELFREIFKCRGTKKN